MLVIYQPFLCAGDISAIFNADGKVPFIIGLLKFSLKYEEFFAGILLNVVGLLISSEHISSGISFSFTQEKEHFCGCLERRNYVGCCICCGVWRGSSFISSNIEI